MPRPFPDAQPNVPATGELAMFGAGRARDLQVAGQELGQASDTLFALYERKAQGANESRVYDLNNQFLDGRHEVLSAGPDAYYNQKGDLPLFFGPRLT